MTAGLFTFWQVKRIVLCGKQWEPTKTTKQKNAMYSSLYGDYLTPVFTQLVVANILE